MFVPRSLAAPALVLVLVLVLGSCRDAPGVLPDAPCAVSCPVGEECSPRSGRCEPEPVKSNAPSCGSDSDCAGSTPRCHAARCVGCLEDADCPVSACDKSLRRCAPLPDGCQTALALDLSSGSTTVRGTTAKAAHDIRARCSLPTSAAPDLVYAFTLKEKRRVVAVATPEPGSSLLPVLELRSLCTSTEAAASLGCGYVEPPAQVAKLSVDGVSPGTYFLWVDGDADTAGGFSLQVTLESSPPGDSCAAAAPLSTAVGTHELSGDTRPLRNDALGTCGGSGAPDGVYELVVNSPQRLQVEAAPLTGGFTPVLYLRRSPCEVGSASGQLACARASGLSSAAAIDIPRLEPGTYYLFVDGAPDAQLQPSAGEFKLRWTLGAAQATPANDQCSGVETLQLPTGTIGAVALLGDTTSAINDAASCTGSGPDVVYRFVLPVARQVVARVLPAQGAANYRPVVYLRGAGRCGSEQPQDLLACGIAPQGATAATFMAANLGPGEYFLWVDGAGGTRGSFSLSVDLSAPVPPPPNDSCGAPQVIAPSYGPVTISGTTTGASDDATSCQVPQGVSSPDVVYEVVVPSRQALAVDLQAAMGSGLRPVIALRRPGACGSNSLSDEIFCSWADPQFPERAVYTVGALEAGSYYLWVDGDYTSHGPFSMRVQLGGAVSEPLNDECGGAQALTPGVTVTGDVRGARNDGAGSCGQLSGVSGEDAPDVTYRFSLATAQPVTVTVTPDPGEGKLFRPVVYVRGPGAAVCDSVAPADQRGCAVASTYGGQAVVSLTGLAPGSYSAWVDGAGSSGGKFTIKWQ